MLCKIVRNIFRFFAFRMCTETFFVEQRFDNKLHSFHESETMSVSNIL